MLCSLLAVVDLGGAVYEETPRFVRLTIYFAGLAFLLWNTSYVVTAKRFSVLVILVAVVVLTTASHPYSIDPYTAWRDVLTLLLGVTVFLTSERTPQDAREKRLMVFFAVGVVASEIINIIFFYRIESGEYLTYASFKFVVTLPVFYCICHRKYALSAATFAVSIFVLVALGARMLVLTFSGVTFLLLARGMGRKILYMPLLVLLVILATSMVVSYFGINLESYRAFTVFSQLLSSNNIADLAASLDPVRWVENNMLVEQGYLNLLFGNGVGSGYFDKYGFFSFIPDDGAAYSSRELFERHYFRFHDSWSWFGYRFGLLLYLLILTWLVVGCLRSDTNLRIWAAITLMAFFNATFSIGGLIVCALLAQKYRLSRYVKDTAAVRAVPSWN